LGITIEASHHEVAAGQYELDLGLTNALKSADQLVTMKHAVKAVAQRRGLLATFMPKPIFGAAGSGMHTHQVLNEAGKEINAFYDRADQYHLSTVAKHFIAGQLAHARAMCAPGAPPARPAARLPQRSPARPAPGRGDAGCAGCAPPRTFYRGEGNGVAEL